MADRKHDAPSGAAQRIEDKLVKETGKAAGDTDKPVDEKFDEMGEQEAVKRSGGRD
jgi:dihydrodipicolinate reductase